MKKKKDAQRTRNAILKVAKAEFAKYGLAGTRVDSIAAKAKVNKNMIYYYFKSKEFLFRTIMEEAYFDIRSAELKLDIGGLSPEEKLIRVIEFTWQYYLDNPEFIRLINSENLHKAKHIKKSNSVQKINQTHTKLMEEILESGVKAGVFREGLEPLQVNLSIAALGYYYLTNQHTLSFIFDIEMMNRKALDARLNSMIEMVLRYVKKEPQT